MKKFITVFILVFVILLQVQAAKVFADYSPYDGKVDLRYVLFFSQKQILVRYDSSTPYPTPAYPYERYEYEYYVSSGVELRNLTDADVKGMKVTCRFLNNWGKDLSVRTVVVNLKKGQKKRVIFHSGLLAENVSGPSVTMSSLTGLITMNLDQERDFLSFGLNPDFDKYHALNTTIHRTITKVTCQFKLEPAGDRD